MTGGWPGFDEQPQFGLPAGALRGARGLDAAAEEDINGLLSELAARWRVSVATQKQALNA
jgi:hypothetical protein